MKCTEKTAGPSASMAEAALCLRYLIKDRPTRFALTVAAWAEPVPKTLAAARRIAAKGHILLARAKRAKEKQA